MSADMKAKEEMLIMAMQSNAPSDVIYTMQKGAEITDSRLDELRKQAQSK